jgi:hypothetical protein
VVFYMLVKKCAMEHNTEARCVVRVSAGPLRTRSFPQHAVTTTSPVRSIQPPRAQSGDLFLGCRHSLRARAGAARSQDVHFLLRDAGV